MASVTRTLLFRIHNPTQHTAAVVYRALVAYTNAARAVLGAAQRDWDALRPACMRNERLNTLMLESELRKRYRARTQPYPLHSSLRDALFADLAAAIASYDELTAAWQKDVARVEERAVALGLALDAEDADLLSLAADEREALMRLRSRRDALGRAPSWPTAPRTKPDDTGYQAALDRITTALPGDPAPPRGRLADLLTTGTRPLWFPRPDGPSGNRNFALLHSARDGRFYALLYLLPQGDARCRPLAVPPADGKRGALGSLNKQALPVPRTTRRSTALCVPLACGEWHEATALREALARPESVRVARLIHRPETRAIHGRSAGGFFLAITFEQQVPDPVPVMSYLGVVMDEEARVWWCVRDGQGAILAEGRDEELVALAPRWREDRRMQMRAGRIPPRAHHLQAAQVEQTVHRIANRLVVLAGAHAALVGVQDTTWLRRVHRTAPVDETGKREPRRPEWHEEAATRHYQRAMLVAAKLHSVLRYKLPRVGALTFRDLLGGISPRDCGGCGQRSERRGACTHCGAALDGTNAARVTAQATEARARAMAERRAQHEQEQDGRTE